MFGKAGFLILAAFALALALPLGAGSPFALDTHVVTREAAGAGYQYVPADLFVDVAGTLTLTNLDLVAHDVVSVADGPETNAWCDRFTTRDCPLFASRLVGLAGQAEVEGLDALPVTDPLGGIITYEFYCSVHQWMTGTITPI